MIMEYCPKNDSLTQLIRDNGLSLCLSETLTSSIIPGYMIIVGIGQYLIYKKYATLVDSQLFNWKNSALFNLQVCSSVLMTLVAIARFVLQATFLYSKTIYGYMILSLCAHIVMWPLSLKIIFLERRFALPSIPTRGHGWTLLIFWTLNFSQMNLTFMNWYGNNWWFQLKNTSDRVELALFVLKYTASCLLFVLGIKAPGIPRYRNYLGYSVQDSSYEAEQSLLNENRHNRSTFSNLWRRIKELLPYVWPKKSIQLQFRVLFCVVLLILGRVANVYSPIYNKLVVDQISYEPTKHTLTFPWKDLLIYILIKFMQGSGSAGLLNNMRQFLWIRVQQYTVKEVRVSFYAHLHSLSLRWHISRKTGEVLRIMDRGTTSINSLLSYIVFSILPAIADIIIAIVYFMIAFNAWFGLIVFISMFLYLLVTIIITEWRTKYRRETNTKDNQTQSKGVDSLLNFETVKYYGGEEYEVERYKQAIESYQASEWKSTASLNMLNTAQNFSICAGLLSGMMLCAYLVSIKHTLTVGDFVLFTAYMTQLYVPLNWFGTYYRMIQQAFIDMENLFDLLHEKKEISDVPNAPDLILTEGKVEFHRVTFHYNSEKRVLNDVSFVVPAGHTVALVGPSGMGKSTIIRLLFRFYDVQGGSILIDGQNIALVSQTSLRRSIGVVPQDTVLFNDDIRYNIRYGRHGANDEEVEKAARAADIHERIISFPEGYNTTVGERGLKLSGGEKQRVAIARTILKSPAIVLLDEATSALDTQTERNIQASLDRVCKNRTSIIVAHRLSTVVNADMILVLNEGEIVERGRHEELLVKNGMYAEMWNMQQADENESKDKNI